MWVYLSNSVRVAVKWEWTLAYSVNSHSWLYMQIECKVQIGFLKFECKFLFSANPRKQILIFLINIKELENYFLKNCKLVCTLLWIRHGGSLDISPIVSFYLNQVVNFYKWSVLRENVTYIEGWKGGKGYNCDDISNNRFTNQTTSILK